MYWYLSLKVDKHAAAMANSDMVVDSEQSNEMKNIVDVINNNFSNVVNTVINESSESSIDRESAKRIWECDCQQKLEKEKQDFQQDQVRNKYGSTTNRWNPITYRIALAVYARSPAAYRALATFKLF